MAPTQIAAVMKIMIIAKRIRIRQQVVRKKDRAKFKKLIIKIIQIRLMTHSFKTMR